MKTFNKGDRVVMHVWRGQPIGVGTVLSLDDHDPSLYVIEWDKGPYDRTTRIDKHAGDYLMSEVDAISKKNRLELDFNNLRASLAPKMQQAIELLNEASAEARKGGQSLRILDEHEELLAAIESAGWNMSSAHC